MTALPLRLSALDASFLAIERPGFPMHVGSVSLFEGGPLRDLDGGLRVDDIRAAIAARLPENAYWRLAYPYGAGRPYWVEDTSFKLANHVLIARVDAPGEERELLALTARLHQRLLDRRRPLWELWFVDGLADGSVAIVEKMHHALVDGLGGVDLATSTLDLTPTAATPAARRPAPITVTRPTLTVLEGVTRAARLAETITAPLRNARQIGRTVSRANALLGGLRTLLADPFAPPSALNAAARTERTLASVQWPLDDVRAIKTSLGGTVNDVVLAVVAGALRTVLDGGTKPLHVLVPVSERTGDGRGAAGNRVAALIVPLPVDEPELDARYRTVVATTAAMKASGVAGTTSALLRAADVLPEPLAALIARQVHRQPLVNLVVTNVPGPPLPLYFNGARMLRAIPVVPLAGNLTLSIGVLSYDTELAIGLLADAATWPDPTCFTSALEHEFRALLERAQPRSLQEAS